ncbi:hypothetical protein [Agrococcus casei]|uniref:hypothetical protein n=1 Tax=Agrococcus casei TaxID=343512 RepID=UPI003F92E07D
MHIILEGAAEASHTIPPYAWVAAGVAAAVFLGSFAVTRAFRDVANRHAVVPEGAEEQQH